jgi:hypothetical protein
MPDQQQTLTLPSRAQKAKGLRGCFVYTSSAAAAIVSPFTVTPRPSPDTTPFQLHLLPRNNPAGCVPTNAWIWVDA